MRLIASRGQIRIGHLHIIADNVAIHDVLEDERARFSACDGALGFADAPGMAQLALPCDATLRSVIDDEMRTLLRSICLTCTGGTSDDAFDANVVGRDAAGHIAMRAILSPALFDVGSMHAATDALLAAAFKRHIASELPAWCRPSDDLDAIVCELRSTIASISCPTVLAQCASADDRARAFIALWVHAATSLSASIAWLLCEWSRGSVSSLSDDEFVDYVMRAHPSIWWSARRALRQCTVRCAPTSHGVGMTTFPYHEVSAGDTVIYLHTVDAGADCMESCSCEQSSILWSFSYAVLLELAQMLRQQHVILAPAAGSSFRPMFRDAMRPERPLLVPYNVQA